MALFNDSGFLRSENVKVFPSAYRGQNTDLEPDVLFDPEARMNSERNFISCSSAGFKDSYIKSWDSNGLDCFVAGYHFRLTILPTEVRQKISNTNDVFLMIKTKMVEIKNDRGTLESNNTPILMDLNGNSANLDNKIGQYYYFTGIRFLSGADLVSLSDFTNNAYFLKIMEANSNAPYKVNFIPKLSQGSVENSLILNSQQFNGLINSGASIMPINPVNSASANYSTAAGYGTAATKANQFVAGQFNSINNDYLFVIGDGEQSAKRIAFATGRPNSSLKYSTFISKGIRLGTNDSDSSSDGIISWDGSNLFIEGPIKASTSKRAAIRLGPNNIAFLDSTSNNNVLQIGRGIEAYGDLTIDDDYNIYIGADKAGYTGRINYYSGGTYGKCINLTGPCDDLENQYSMQIGESGFTVDYLDPDNGYCENLLQIDSNYVQLKDSIILRCEHIQSSAVAGTLKLTGGKVQINDLDIELKSLGNQVGLSTGLTEGIHFYSDVVFRSGLESKEDIVLDNNCKLRGIATEAEHAGYADKIKVYLSGAQTWESVSTVYSSIHPKLTKWSSYSGWAFVMLSFEVEGDYPKQISFGFLRAGTHQVGIGAIDGYGTKFSLEIESNGTFYVKKLVNTAIEVTHNTYTDKSYVTLPTAGGSGEIISNSRVYLNAFYIMSNY